MQIRCWSIKIKKIIKNARPGLLESRGIFLKWRTWTTKTQINCQSLQHLREYFALLFQLKLTDSCFYCPEMTPPWKQITKLRSDAANKLDSAPVSSSEELKSAEKKVTVTSDLQVCLTVWRQEWRERRSSSFRNIQHTWVLKSLWCLTKN